MIFLQTSNWNWADAITCVLFDVDFFLCFCCIRHYTNNLIYSCCCCTTQCDIIERFTNIYFSLFRGMCVWVYASTAHTLTITFILLSPKCDSLNDNILVFRTQLYWPLKYARVKVSFVCSLNAIWRTAYKQFNPNFDTILIWQIENNYSITFN